MRVMRRGNLSITLLFFFNDTATTEIYTLSLHDALPIYFATLWQEMARKLSLEVDFVPGDWRHGVPPEAVQERLSADRKSTRLNSSHANISYAVFCLKKKKNSTSLLR